MSEWSGREWGAITEERLVRAVAALTDITKEHGPRFEPLLEKLNQDLIEFRLKHGRSAEDPCPLSEEHFRKAV